MLESIKILLKGLRFVVLGFVITRISFVYVSVERAPTPIRKKWKCRGSLWVGLHKDWLTDNQWHRIPDSNSNQVIFRKNRIVMQLPTENWRFSAVESVRER